MNPLYLPMLLAAAAVQPADTVPTLTPLSTQVSTDTREPPPSATLAAPTASATARPTETELPSPTASEPPPLPTIGPLPLEARSMKVWSVARGELKDWQAWVEYDNPFRDLGVASVSAVLQLQDRRGAAMGERGAQVSDPVPALPGERGCFHARWTTPKAVTGAAWSITARPALPPLYVALPVTVYSADQLPGEPSMKVVASSPVTRSTGVKLTVILRGPAGVTACGQAGAVMDPARPATFTVSVGERVLAASPDRLFGLRSLLPRP